MRLSPIFALSFFILLLLRQIPAFAVGYFPETSLAQALEFPQNGKIKFREDWIYKIENNKVVSVGIQSGYEKYNSAGYKLEEAAYDHDGKVLLEATYTYDEWGREAQCLGFKDNKSFFNKWEYSFNEYDKVLEKKLYNCTNNNKKSIYHLDASGNVIKEINFDEEGTLNYRYEIKYTNFNRIAELIEYGANGELFEKWEFTYNAKHQNTEVIQYDSNQMLYKKYVIRFDEDGNLKEIMIYDKEGNAIEKRVSIYQYF